MLSSMEASLSGTAAFTAILFCAFYILGIQRYDKDLPGKTAFVFYSVFLALIWLMAESFRIDNSLRYLNAEAGQVLKSLIYLAGSSYLIFESLSAFCHLLTKKNDLKTPFSGIFQKIDAHPFLVPFAAFLLVWAIPIIVCYPAYTCNDSWTQLLQYFGYLDFTTHHPPIHTLLMGMFCRAGMAVGSINAGLFAFVLLQAFVFAAVLAYTYRLMVQLESPLWLRNFFLIYAAVAPHFSDYVCVLIKDSLFSIMVLLFIDEFILALSDPEAFFSKKANWILSFISVMGVLLFRNNGKHILYPTFAVAVAAAIVLRRKLGDKNLLKALILTALPVLCASVLENSVIRIYNIDKGSIGEALSFPFQQTARTVKEHGDEITQAEREAIDAVLDYDGLAEKYRPMISDPVKDTIRKDADKAAIKRYLVTWFKMFFKYPFTYVKATVNQTYLLFYPMQENIAIYCNLFNHVKSRKEVVDTIAKETGLYDTNRFPALRITIYKLQRLLYSLPLTGIFLHHSSYVIILLATIILALQKKVYKYLLASLPILLSVAVIILAPTIRSHPRYAYPIMYTVPILLAYYIFCTKAEKKAAKNAVERKRNTAKAGKAKSARA